MKVAQVEDPETRALLLQFESLGCNCEFGLVQRRFMGEPLSLLRWMTTTPEVLIELLRNRFQGVGELTQLRLSTTPWGEFVLRDPKYRFWGHSFVRADSVDRQQFRASQGTRLKFLAAKLVRDLENAEKVFVYQSPDVSEADVQAIFGLLKGYGGNALLVARAAGGGRSAGTLVDRGDGLFEGYLAHHGKSRGAGGGDVWKIDFAGWVEICGRCLEAARRFLPTD